MMKHKKLTRLSQCTHDMHFMLQFGLLDFAKYVHRQTLIQQFTVLLCIIIHVRAEEIKVLVIVGKTVKQ